ncbi:unnamed protein product [Pichia kudriavzevii]
MSLYQIQKDALISDLNRVSSSHRHLIADDTTYPIIDKLFKDDVLNYVYTFKRIDSPDRSKNRDSALYILDPSRSFSLNCLAADFSKGQRYKDVVVMFIPGHWEHFWENMQKNHYFKESLVLSKVPLILEYMSFVPLEPPSICYWELSFYPNLLQARKVWHELFSLSIRHSSKFHAWDVCCP